MSYEKRVRFINVESDRIKEIFLKTLHQFPVLHPHIIRIKYRPLRHTTMQAQPVLNRHFFHRRRRHYQIDINDHTRINRHIRVDELPEAVLAGWFAHELGHLVDYLKRGGFNLMGFGFGYVAFEYFRIGAERMADLHAIDHGFGEHIKETKKFILEESSLPNEYKTRIERFYMSPEEVELMLGQEVEEEVCMDRPEMRPWQ